MASYRVVNGQKVLVSATQRPAPMSSSASTEPAATVEMAAAVLPVVAVAPAAADQFLAGLTPANHQDVVTEEPSNGG